MSLAVQLAVLKAKRSMTTEQLSKASGVPVGTINKLLNGETRNPTAKTLGRIAEALGSTVEALYGKDGEVRMDAYLLKNPEDILPVSMRRIPLVGDIACGQPTFAQEDIECYISAGADIKADFVLCAKGDSMIGANIHDGYLVFIHKQDTVENGEIAAVIIDDEATLKRVYWLRDGTMELRAENPRYAPMILGGEEEMRSIYILGKAVAFQGNVV